MTVTKAPQSNIEIIFSDWLDAIRCGDVERMAARLADDVIHEGVRPEWICRGREAVLSMAERRAENPPEVEAVELVAAGDHIVMSVRGPQIGVPEEPDAETYRGQACIVFTLQDGKITHMRDFLRRDDALDSVDAEGGWQ